MSPSYLGLLIPFTILINNSATNIRPQDCNMMRKILAQNRKAWASFMGSKKRAKLTDPEPDPMEAPIGLDLPEVIRTTSRTTIDALPMLIIHPASMARSSSSSTLVMRSS